MINVEIKGEINFPDITLQDELSEIADKIFIPILQGNIQLEQDLREEPYPPLSPNTIAQKKRKNLSEKILTATGKLRRSFFSYKRGEKSVVITLHADRKEIGDILQNQGVRSKVYGKRYFNFFGISESMEKEALDFARDELEKKIANA